jgi:hypothetical protein
VGASSGEFYTRLRAPVPDAVVGHAQYEQSDVAPATAEDQALAATAVVIPLDNRRKRNGGGSPRKGGRSSNKGPGVSNLFEPTEDAVAKAFAETYGGFRPGTVANCSMWPATAGPLGSNS